MTTTETRSLSAQTRDLIPGYLDAIARRDRLSRMTMATAVQGELDEGFRQRIRAAADDPKVTSLDDLRAAYTEAKAAQESVGEFGQLVLGEIRRATDGIERTLDAGTDVALDHLRGVLAELVDEIRDQRDRLAAHPSVEAAAAAGGDTLEQWRATEDLIRRYGELGSVHAHWVRRQDRDLLSHVVATFGQCRRFLDADPHLLIARRLAHPPTSDSAAPILDWFESDTACAVEDTAQRTNPYPFSFTAAEWLLRVVDHEPWLPDAATLAEAHRLTDQLLNRRTYRDPNDVELFRRTLAAVEALTD